MARPFAVMASSGGAHQDDRAHDSEAKAQRVDGAIGQAFAARQSWPINHG